MTTEIVHEINNVKVEQRRDDGFLNGTAMCVAHNKDISNWLKTEETWKLVVALAEDLGMEPKTIKSGDSVYKRVSATYPSLLVSKRGSPEKGGGTWLHPDLAMQLAQWCNPVFAIQVSRWIREWMTTGLNPVQNELALQNAQEIEQLKQSFAALESRLTRLPQLAEPEPGITVEERIQQMGFINDPDHPLHQPYMEMKDDIDCSYRRYPHFLAECTRLAVNCYRFNDVEGAMDFVREAPPQRLHWNDAGVMVGRKYVFLDNDVRFIDEGIARSLHRWTDEGKR